jgi:hypothetical protein
MKNVSINDLNPRPSSFVLAGETHVLKKFSLAAQVWAHSEFATAEEPNGLVNLSQKLTELDEVALMKSCYWLLEDKSKYPTEDSFIDCFKDKYDALKVLLEPFSECLGVSQPETSTADEVELKK